MFLEVKNVNVQSLKDGSKLLLFMSAEGTVVAAGLEENVFAATILWMPRMGMTGRLQPRLSLQSGVHTTNSTR